MDGCREKEQRRSPAKDSARSSDKGRCIATRNCIPNSLDRDRRWLRFLMPSSLCSKSNYIRNPGGMTSFSSSLPIITNSDRHCRTKITICDRSKIIDVFYQHLTVGRGAMTSNSFTVETDTGERVCFGAFCSCFSRCGNRIQKLLTEENLRYLREKYKSRGGKVVR